MNEYITKNPNQTKKIAEKLAKDILSSGGFYSENKNSSTVLSLFGNLGSGKTTFLQGFAKGLNIKEKILSPTFVLMKRFCILESNQFKIFYHIDCYRFEKAEDILNLDFKKILSNSENIIAIEWADKIKKVLPKRRIEIKFEFIDEKTRKILII